MLLLKCVLLAGGIGMIVTSAVMLLSDAHRMWVLSEPVVVRRHSAGRLAAFACILILPALSIVVVPSGMAGVGGSSVSGGLVGPPCSGAPLGFPPRHPGGRVSQ